MEFDLIRDCFNRHATEFLRAMTDAEEDVAICLSSRFMEVVNVAKDVLDTIEQLESNETIARDEIHFVREAQKTISTIADDMYHCSQAMTDVMEHQNVDATQAFEVCTDDQISKEH